MRIPDHVIAQQMVRLSRLANQPEDPALKSEVEAALRSCANAEHCVQVADAWMRKSKWAPYPSDIFETIEANPYQVRVSAGKDYSCVCGGTGYEPVWELVTYGKMGGACHKSVDIITDAAEVERLKTSIDGVGQMIYSAVRRCTHCSYGRAVATVEAA